ncbi:MAG: hypothetical protein L0H63_10090 [Nitrococcus sp.]|nr:hypothetical protein [Nitrococcus sp.]
MLFYVRAESKKGFIRTQDGKQFVFSVLRGLVAIAFPTLLLASAFVAHSQEWIEGATVILHMAEVTFGGIAGAIFGETVAQSELRRGTCPQ